MEKMESFPRTKKKDLRRRKEKKPSKKPEKPRRARPEAVPIKPAEGISYASILRELKKRVNLTNWAPHYKESGRHAPRTCWWN